MLRRLAALLFALALPAHGQVAVTGGSINGVTLEVPAGEDFAARSTCIGLWIRNDSTTTSSDSAEDECSSNRGADDLSPSGNTSSTCSSGLPTGSPSGDCYVSFDGDTDYLELADGAGGQDDFEGDSAYTAGCWVYAADVFSTYIAAESGTFGGWRLQKGNNAPWVAHNSGASETSGTTIAASTWYHIVSRWADDADDEIEPFTNGQQDCAGACTTSTTTPSQAAPLRVGNTPGGFNDWSGRLYECWYVAEALTDEEICQICRCGFRDQATDRTSACGSCSMGAASCSN